MVMVVLFYLSLYSSPNFSVKRNFPMIEGEVVTEIKPFPGHWRVHNPSRVVYRPPISRSVLLAELQHEAALTSDWMLTSGTWQDDRWTIPFDDSPRDTIAVPLTYRPFELVYPSEMLYYLTPHEDVYTRNACSNIVGVHRMGDRYLCSVVDEAVYLLQILRGE